MGEIRGFAHVAKDACRCGRCGCRRGLIVLADLGQPDDPGYDIEKPESIPTWWGMARSTVMTFVLLCLMALVIVGYNNYSTVSVLNHPVELVP